MIILGITGSIGMGKSTVGTMLKTLGVPVHDSDQVAREVMREGGKAMPAVRAAFPYFEYPDIYGPLKKRRRYIDRAKLAGLVFGDSDQALAEREKLEKIIHPLVREAQQKFIKSMARMGKDMVALDIPLLFEKALEHNVDYTFVVSAPYHVQRARVLSRPGMSEADFVKRVNAQMPDGEKRLRADYVIESGLSRALTMRQLKQAVTEIRAHEFGPRKKKAKIYDP